MPVVPHAGRATCRSCHWLSEPCERSQCEAACGRMDNNLTLAALAELLLRYRPRLDGSLRPVPPNHFRCKPFHSIATEPLILSCRPSLECSCATFLSEPCERLVWHRDQVDRRPQFNEFRGGQMPPRPRAAKRPSVCSAWVSGQFPPAHRRFAPRTGLSSGRPLEGYSGHLTVTTRKHDPVRSSHGHRSQHDARTPIQNWREPSGNGWRVLHQLRWDLLFFRKGQRVLLSAGRELQIDCLRFLIQQIDA
jgi:hypothetical protein